MRVRICGISILFLQTQQTVQHFLSERRVYTVQPDDNSGHQRRRSDSSMVHVRVQPATALIVLDKLKEADKKNSRWESDKKKTDFQVKM